MADQASTSGMYTISPSVVDPGGSVFITGPGAQHWTIHREDADPEHRFVQYRLAAGWFGNLPAEENR